MLPPHADAIMLMGSFGSGKSFSFAAHKRMPLLLPYLEGPKCFILQMCLTFKRESLMHMQDQVVTELLASRPSRKRWRRRSRTLLQCGRFSQEDASLQSILVPYVLLFSQSEPQGPASISMSPKRYLQVHKLGRHIVTTSVCTGSAKEF